MTSPMPQHTVNENAHGSAFRWQARPTGFGSEFAGAQATSQCLNHTLHLNTKPHAVHRALIGLFTEAMQETNDAARAGRLLLSLWSPAQHHLDLNDLGFFEPELNAACRHLLNFIIGLGMNFRDLVTYTEMEPVIAAWGEPTA